MHSASIHRVLAFAILIITPSSTVEGMVNLVRDGEAHHETASAAATHCDAGARGDHGHEDVPHSGEDAQNPQHQHGTAGDHCTHFHSIGMVAVMEWSFSAVSGAFALMQTFSRSDRTTVADAPPPKA